MNNSLTRLILILLLAALAVPTLLMQQPASQATAAVSTPSDQLAPESRHRFASRLATRFMTSFHYRSPEMDTAFSERVFDADGAPPIIIIITRFSTFGIFFRVYVAGVIQSPGLVGIALTILGVHTAS